MSSFLAPSWWSEDALRACVQAAESALPNEVCGLLCTHGGRAELHILPSVATPYFVEAKPESVVALAYQFEREGREVVATFHSHPQGQREFSKRDSMLCLWAQSHVLAVKTKGGWEINCSEWNKP